MRQVRSLVVKLKKSEISNHCSKVIIICGKVRNKQFERQWGVGSEVLTFSLRHQGDVVGENALGNGRTRRNAGVVAGVRGFHFGDIEVTIGLGDKTPLVQRDEGGEFVKDPSE